MQLPEHVIKVYETAQCLFTKAQVESALTEMAKEIHDNLSETNPIFLTVMVGGMIPAAGLLERIDFPLEMDYVHATRYRGQTHGGELFWKTKPSSNLKDRVVLVIDDILDGGITLQQIVNFCYEQQAKKVYTGVLVDKKDVRLPGGLLKADFTGLYADNYYLFGYGLDYKEYLRNAPGIYAVAKEFL